MAAVGFVFVTGILAAIAIPNFAAYRTRAFNSAAQKDLMNAAAAQVAFHEEYKTYADSIDKLKGASYGLQISEGVDLTIQFADAERCMMTAFHERGNENYVIQGPEDGIIEMKKF